MRGKNYIVRSDHSGTRITPDHEANFTDWVVGPGGLGILGIAIAVTIGLPILAVWLLYRVVLLFFRAPFTMLFLAALTALAAYINYVGPNGLIHMFDWPFTSPAMAPAVPSQSAASTPVEVNETTEQPPAVVADQPPSVVEVIKHVSAESLNMRANPGADQAIITKLHKDTEVTLVGETQVAPDGGQWIKVRAGEHEGWVNQKFLR